MGTVKYLDMKSKPLCSAIYVKFDHPKAGNSLTDRRLHNQLNECVPIPARIKTFLLNKCISTVIAEKKQLLLILDHAITAQVSRKYCGLSARLLKSIPGKKTATGRIINNLYLRVNFIPYFPVPKVVIRFYC